MRLGRNCADERERYGVLSGIAAFPMGRVVVAVCDDPVMLVSREPVVVLRMIVVVVDVSVQQGHGPRRGDQRRNEQQRQRAVHNDESMGRSQSRSKAAHDAGYIHYFDFAFAHVC